MRSQVSQARRENTPTPTYSPTHPPPQVHALLSLVKSPGQGEEAISDGAYASVLSQVGG